MWYYKGARDVRYFQHKTFISCGENMFIFNFPFNTIAYYLRWIHSGYVRSNLTKTKGRWDLPFVNPYPLFSMISTMVVHPISNWEMWVRLPYHRPKHLPKCVYYMVLGNHIKLPSILVSSTTVVRPAVNRRVVGSNPTSPANRKNCNATDYWNSVLYSCSTGVDLRNIY